MIRAGAQRRCWSRRWLALRTLSSRRAEDGRSSPTFKAATSLVEVDIIARDGDGRFVSGLTADDFEVFEEGKPQAIAHFYLVTESPATLDRAARRRRPAAVAGPDRSPHLRLLLRQPAPLGGQPAEAEARRRRFRDRQRPPDGSRRRLRQRRAVHNHLTNDRQELLDAIGSVSPAFETTDAQARTLLEYPRIDSFFDAARIDGGDNGSFRKRRTKALRRRSAGSAQLEGGREFVEDALQRKARRFIEDSRRTARIDGRLADLRDEESRAARRAQDAGAPLGGLLRGRPARHAADARRPGLARRRDDLQHRRARDPASIVA